MYDNDVMSRGIEDEVIVDPLRSTAHVNFSNDFHGTNGTLFTISQCVLPYLFTIIEGIYCTAYLQL